MRPVASKNDESLEVAFTVVLNWLSTASVSRRVESVAGRTPVGVTGRAPGAGRRAGFAWPRAVNAVVNKLRTQESRIIKYMFLSFIKKITFALPTHPNGAPVSIRFTKLVANFYPILL